jgi:hypothetical protein
VEGAHARLISRLHLVGIGSGLRLIAALLIAGMALVVLAGVRAGALIAIAAVALVGALVELAQAAFELVDRERSRR